VTIVMFEISLIGDTADIKLSMALLDGLCLYGAASVSYVDEFAHCSVVFLWIDGYLLATITFFTLASRFCYASLDGEQ